MGLGSGVTTARNCCCLKNSPPPLPLLHLSSISVSSVEKKVQHTHPVPSHTTQFQKKKMSKTVTPEGKSCPAIIYAPHYNQSHTFSCPSHQLSPESLPLSSSSSSPGFTVLLPQQFRILTLSAKQLSGLNVPHLMSPPRILSTYPYMRTTARRNPSSSICSLRNSPFRAHPRPVCLPLTWNSSPRSTSKSRSTISPPAALTSS